MSSFSGAVIGREQVTRRCGCVVEFLHYESDPYRAARKEKMQQKRCPPCGKKASEVFSAQQAADAKALRDARKAKTAEQVAADEAAAQEKKLARRREHDEKIAEQRRRGEPTGAGAVFTLLPAGACLGLERLPSGRWVGWLAGVAGQPNITRDAAGPVGLLFKLAQEFERQQAPPVTA